jgi:glycogen(starch) synthase
VRVVLAGGYRGCGGEDLARRWIGPELEPYRDRLHFPGWLDAEGMTAWYAKADILVVPSWYEPFGMVVLEGMLHGLAIAASDIGGPREILENEQTGLLFPPRDVTRLGEALGRLADSEPLRARLGRAGAARVRQHWSYDRVVRDMTAVYSLSGRNSQKQSAMASM